MIGETNISRRSLLQNASLATLYLTAGGKAQAKQSPATKNKLKFGIGKGPKTGEPYELAGNRIVFTNWYYVRFGSFGYFDAKGNKISLGDYSGLLEAEMHQFDAPSGSKLLSAKADSFEG